MTSDVILLEQVTAWLTFLAGVAAGFICATVYVMSYSRRNSEPGRQP